MNNMEARFYVIDAEGNVSYSAKKDAPEHFKTRANAFQRARELAKSEPGRAVHVVETAEVVMCEISEPKRMATYKRVGTKRV